MGCLLDQARIYKRMISYLGLQKVGTIPEILETNREFWKVSGNLLDIFHHFATLILIKQNTQEHKGPLENSKPAHT